MKLYLVISYVDYEGGQVIAACTTQEKAEEIKKLVMEKDLNTETVDGGIASSGDSMGIVEMETDQVYGRINI